MSELLQDRFFSDHPAGTYDRIIWKNILSRVLLWHPEQVEVELAELDRLLARTAEFHYHETALWYVAHQLIPEDVYRRLDVFEANRLAHRMDGIVFPNGEPAGSLEEAESFDWDTARSRLVEFWDRYRIDCGPSSGRP